MKTTVIGAKVTEATLRAACTKVDVPPGDVRTIGDRAWIELPRDVRAIVLDRLADELHTTMSVVEVDVPPIAGTRQRGEGVSASRSTHRGVTEDLSELARDTLHGWLADASRSVDDPSLISELAWELIARPAARDKGESAAAPVARPAVVKREVDRDDTWARAIVDRLMNSGMLELHGTKRPVAELAGVLKYVSREIEPWLAERLLDKLVASDVVDEVFVAPDELAQIARETKPR